MDTLTDERRFDESLQLHAFGEVVYVYESIFLLFGDLYGRGHVQSSILISFLVHNLCLPN